MSPFYPILIDPGLDSLSACSWTFSLPLPLSSSAHFIQNLFTLSMMRKQWSQLDFQGYSTFCLIFAFPQNLIIITLWYLLHSICSTFCIFYLIVICIRLIHPTRLWTSTVSCNIVMHFLVTIMSNKYCFRCSGHNLYPQIGHRWTMKTVIQTNNQNIK